MNPRTPLEAFLANLYDAQVEDLGRGSRRYRGLRISERAAVRAMWLAVVRGERDLTVIASAAERPLKAWSRNWCHDDWEEFHVPTMQRFAGRLIAAHEARQVVAP